MAPPRDDSKRLGSLIMTLASKDGMARQRARHALVALGKPAVGPLVAALSDPRKRVRWEAAKALTVDTDVSAIPALIVSLEDYDHGICWLAAEGLIALKAVALIPLLESLKKRPRSAELREAVHHILKAQRDPDLRYVLAPVLKALGHFAPEKAAPVAAQRALKELRKRNGSRQGQPPRGN